MKNLQETGTKMLSDDYKERFKAEYWQTKIRYEKLKQLNNKIEAYYEHRNIRVCDDLGSCLGFDLACNPELLKRQQHTMGEYLHILEIRAVIEGVDLDD